MILLPSGYNYPITIQATCQPLIFSSSEFQQRSGFSPVRSTTLNYLGLSEAAVDSLLAVVDTAGSVDRFEWPFRAHYSAREWLVESSRIVTLDAGRLTEVFLELREYPTVRSGYLPPTSIPDLGLTPDQAPVTTRRSRFLATQMGYFFDRAKEAVNSASEAVQFTTTTGHPEADAADVLLDRHRGVYPLLWQNKTYTCSGWQITYHPEFAEIELTLDTFYSLRR